MRASIVALVPLSLAVAATALAYPPDGDERGLVDGANHRVGDAGFIALEGREPTKSDSERARIHDHLVYMRKLLAARPATRPQLASKRTELLGYLDDYIAVGITPHNDAMPWRSPVFIDGDGRICAVGYLIERSVGRDVAEWIASAHRYDYLEDIAAAMPEVDAWIASSGLTLDELASIQPGYNQPAIKDWTRWNVQALPPPDGPYRDTTTTGAWRGRRMEETWTRTIAGHVVGTGTLHRGTGEWTSFYHDGSKLAKGRIVDNDPSGVWTFYHPSGNIAAEGRFFLGLRSGEWRFYYDTADKTPIAKGAFSHNSVSGEWKHYDEHGHLLAVSSSATPAYDYGFGGYLLSIVPDRDGLKHEIHTLGGPDENRVDALVWHDETLYVHDRLSGVIYDADGNKLEKTDGTWYAASCGWSAKRKRIAHAGDVTTLHGLLFYDNRKPRAECGDPQPVDATRGSRIDRMIGELETVRVHTPAFVHALAANQSLTTIADDNADPDNGSRANSDDNDNEDLAGLLAKNMVWYVEFPHVDGRFVQVFRTVPGYWLGQMNGTPREESKRSDSDL